MHRRAYLHTKQGSYLVECPRCQARGHKTTCRICEGAGKVSPEVWERISDYEKRGK